MEKKTAEAPRPRSTRRVWLGRLLEALVLYVIAVGVNLLVRSMMHDWTWYEDLLSSSLITALAVPAAVLLIALITS
jgi:hypothetical protein